MTDRIGKALVIGAGISGIRSALDLAENGYKVILIDHKPHVGGFLSQLDHQFPTNNCGMCKMLPLIDHEDASTYCLRKGFYHENIEIHLGTTLAGVSGSTGNFTIRLHRMPTWIDPARCVGCGVCADVCPVRIPDAFNEGLSSRKAVYLPVPHAIPNAYVIDPVACDGCGACVDICPVNAIELPGQKRKGFRILVVDDELVVRDSLKEWLEDEGFYVAMADSGSTALSMMETTSFHLMLTDIKMPGMGGVELLEIVHEKYADLIVVMMTAYATVETAVDAMKTGARDYLMKPFDPEVFMSMVQGIYEERETITDREVDVGAIIFSGGSELYEPGQGKNPFGYGVLPGVVTNIELERMLSGLGPTGGRLVRPVDGKSPASIAWLQCVGSRDLQTDNPHCASVCCMIAVKQAVLARRKNQGRTRASVFYLDMRTCGKSFDRYRDTAEKTHGVRFTRARIHSLCATAGKAGLLLRYADASGMIEEENYDLVVLSIGQRAGRDLATSAERMDLSVDKWGYWQHPSFLNTRTEREGVFMGGAATGPRDIRDSVVHASAAANAAMRAIHRNGGSLALPDSLPDRHKDISTAMPDILVVICTCTGRLDKLYDRSMLTKRLRRDSAVRDVTYLDQVCTSDGWQQLKSEIIARQPNRLLIGACHPCIFTSRTKELSRETGLDPLLIEVVDLGVIAAESAMRIHHKPALNPMDAMPQPVFAEQLRYLNMALARLRDADPGERQHTTVTPRALVIGGGIAGLTAAVAIAECGFPVDLVEKTDAVGGNLNWLTSTLEGASPADLLAETRQRLTDLNDVHLHVQSKVISTTGQVGQYTTMIRDRQEKVRTIDHGVVILATGGDEAPTTTYGHTRHPGIVTLKEFEKKYDAREILPSALETVVMIQCVDCRKEPRNYCSRVCCPSALKDALMLKQQNPRVQVFILYRDMMTTGSVEMYYARARRDGVIFMQHDADAPPDVTFTSGGRTSGKPVVRTRDPVLQRQVEITADLVVLSTGIIPHSVSSLLPFYGVETDPDGFIASADEKWRPVDSGREGVFVCGLALAPGNIADTVAGAEAAAQRSLRILNRRCLTGSKNTAFVRDSLCSLCERCIDTCPSGARQLDADSGRVVVNPGMCQGCGACAAVCPNDASVLSGYSGKQMLSVIDAAVG
ncbi:MAG: FAD-dependent oxidoreductase [Desulfobacteraceae bacterium]|nr:FAD-dependent oxidoreductase [Desulfobacteraceae bacterium]